MLITLILVVLVIFAFLHSGSATLIPALALPFSILGTFAVMQVLDFTLDNLSMMALILSIGFVVDDAIVMLENIVRHMETGRDAARGVADGLEGNRLHDRLDDRLAGRGLHPDSVHERHPRPAVPRVRGHDHGGDSDLRRRLGDADADAVQPLPERGVAAQQGPVCAVHGEPVRAHATASTSGACAACCGHRPVMLGVFVAVLVATVAMFDIVPKGFIPDQDNDSLNINVLAAQGTSYYDMVDYTGKIAAIINANPDVDTFFASTGGGFGSMNTGALQRAAEAAASTAAERRRRSPRRFGRSCCAFPASGRSSACRRRFRSADTAATARTT